MATRDVFPRLVILGLATLGFAAGLPQHVKLEVRLDQRLCSETASSGDRFRATLDRDVTLGDRRVLKKGAGVEGVVRQAESTWNGSQAGELELVVSSVVSEGNNYAVTTSPLWISETRRQALPMDAPQRSRAPSPAWSRAGPRTYRERMWQWADPGQEGKRSCRPSLN